MYKKKYLITLVIFFCASILVTFFAISNSSSLNKHFNEAVSQEKEEYKFRLVGIVCSYVNRFYVEPDRIKPKEMLKASLSWLERIIPEVQVNVDDKSEKIEILVDETSKVVDISKIRRLGELYNTLNDVLHFVNDNKHHEIKTEDIEYAAINGMLSQLDPHSVVFPPKDFDEFKIGTSGKFGGLGMVVGLRDGILTVISPIEGTPAFRAGLKSGDKIIAIDEDSTINMSLQEAVNKLRGDPSTAVILIVESKKSQTNKTVTLIREIISIPSVSSKLADGNIGYIKIRNFQEDTAQSLEEEIEKLTTESGELKGVILDLRNNAGGLLGQAIAVADKFLSSGMIVVTVEPMGKQKIQKAKKSSKDLNKCPLVVIIDAGSASGAEIVAGALKDNNRAPLIGDTSFGKGSIQQLIDLINSGAALKLTVGKYLTPNFTDIQSVGISPDVLLVQSRVTKDEIVLFNENPHFREEDLKKHLGEHSEAEVPYEKVRYLVHVDDEKEEGEEGEKEEKIKEEDYYKIPDLDKDTHVQFAKKIILNSHLYGKNDDFLDQLKPIIEEFKKSEETKIADALNTQDIDWSTGETTFLPSVTTTLKLTPSNGEVKAAEELKIEISVTNNSEGPLYQLRGMTESKNLLINKREFIFGKVEKGETKTSSKTIKIPQNSVNRKDELIVKFNEFNGNTLEDVKGSVLIDALPKPVFSYSHQIIDEGEGLTGNGDGIIQKGEVVDLVLFVKNIGKGTSEKNIIALRKLSQKEVYIERGKMELGELLPGESKSLKIKLSVRDTLEADDFSVDLTIADTTYGTRISGKLEFDVDLNGKNGKMESTEKTLKVIDDSVPIYNGKSPSTPVISYASNGTTLIADKETESWYRVKMPEGRFGWISSDHVEISWRAYSGQQTVDDLFLQNVPPLIELDTQKPHDTFRQEHISLSGTVRDDNAIKYVYILVNEDKVFYKSNRDASEEDKSTLAFASDVPLEDGPNIISIVTRDDQDLLSTKSFVVTQLPTEEKDES
ncbi:MAG: PDZ domain-containing protein [Candidatus Scalindua sp.]|jgi:carboxyl-terminal processing protease|nr:PDZ domain-containing protein [Candidatus Scalindua sp.]MBT5307622.1 PDZ domain-containing protein [Candidatus Scalindua sp.]MBT6230466.1 PDZ domain-containing protein [Candidatus Scalindua sp.]MBT6565068.1 PDZ domain-containing protein [Candidatus Scalindua sp.]MBT7211336.1 PDZ domain-containing protein [Candidatus Scalindua sp.]